LSTETISFYREVETELETIRHRLDRQLLGEGGQIDALCRHVDQYRGKMLRPTLLLLSGRACGELNSRHIDYGTLIELLHLATLIHDDVLDQAKVRRQSVTVNNLWGNEAGVLLGDFLLSKVFDLTNQIEEPANNRQFSEAAKTVCRGELMQSLCRRKWDMTEEQYREIIRMKTGVLYQFCARIGAGLAGGSEEEISAMDDFGRLIGESFQIADDLLDIVGRESRTGKTLGTDLLQGKPTLPIIHYLRQSDADGREKIIGLLTASEIEIYKIRALLEEAGSLQYTQEQARRLSQEARQKLRTLKASPARDSLTELADFVVKRSC
jgi:octaprenyl-diphosphate synthase